MRGHSLCGNQTRDRVLRSDAEVIRLKFDHHRFLCAGRCQKTPDVPPVLAPDVRRAARVVGLPSKHSAVVDAPVQRDDAIVVQHLGDDRGRDGGKARRLFCTRLSLMALARAGFLAAHLLDFWSLEGVGRTAASAFASCRCAAHPPVSRTAVSTGAGDQTGPDQLLSARLGPLDGWGRVYYVGGFQVLEYRADDVWWQRQCVLRAFCGRSAAHGRVATALYVGYAALTAEIQPTRSCATPRTLRRPSVCHPSLLAAYE